MLLSAECVESIDDSSSGCPLITPVSSTQTAADVGGAASTLSRKSKTRSR